MNITTSTPDTTAKEFTGVAIIAILHPDTGCRSPNLAIGVRDLLERLIRNAVGARGREMWSCYTDAKQQLERYCQHDFEQYEAARMEYVRRARL